MTRIFSDIREMKKMVLGGKVLRLNLTDRHEKEYFQALKGERKTIDQCIADTFIRDGDVVLDVGANIGFCALYYIESGADEVFAFEPHPGLYRRLERLADDRIHTHRLALTDKVGSAELMLSTGHNQGHTLNHQWLSMFPNVYAESSETHEVLTTTLDEFLTSQKFDFMKVDIEGSEAAFLRGANNTLSIHPPRILQIEIYPEVFDETFSLLNKHFTYIKRCVLNQADGTIKLVDPHDNENSFGGDTNPNPPVFLCSNHFLICGEHLRGKWQTQSGYPVHEFFAMEMFGGACLQKLIDEYGQMYESVLDVGSGEGRHSEIFRKYGKKVTEVDLGTSCYFKSKTVDRDAIFGDYLEIDLPGEFDLIWACHVLEHQKDVNRFLSKIHDDLREGGILAITVPPLKHEIVGGHLSLWNAGLLMYNLILAGFDCREAKILHYGYNISLILHKRPVVLPELTYDKGDIERLLEYFPPGTTEPFNGDIRELNWLI